MSRSSLVGSLGRGLVAGAAGTAAMTGYQLAVRKARGQALGTPVPRTWAEAPAPAQVAKKAADSLGKGRRVTKKDVPLLTNAMHWLYGITWGIAYGAAAHTLRPRPVAGAGALGAGLWAAQYAELVPLGIAEPPWDQPAQELVLDVSYHLVYGAAVAATFAVLD